MHHIFFSLHFNNKKKNGEQFKKNQRISIETKEEKKKQIGDQTIFIKNDKSKPEFQRKITHDTHSLVKY